MADNLTFLPFLRSALSKEIADPDPLTAQPNGLPRAQVDVRVKLMADGQARPGVSRRLELLGPGDVTGFTGQAVVKTEPRPGIVNFEPNFLPYIDFYEEDFPWRYTPAKANNDRRLRPWIALIVLKEEEFDRAAFEPGMINPAIRVFPGAQGNVFPPADQLWAWAHVQVNAGADAGGTVLEKLGRNPNLGVSRLICPRRLAIKTAYYAFVVPAFEAGRLAGLGKPREEIDAAGRWTPSWGQGQELWPVYYQWQFQTGGNEDFESLVRRIRPQPVPAEVGKHLVDLSRPGYGGTLFNFNGTLPGYPRSVMPMEGAVKLVDSVIPSLPESNTAEATTYRKNLATLLNLGLETGQKPSLHFPKNPVFNSGDPLDDDPMIVPPVYGRWHAKADGMAMVNPDNTGHWLEQINLDPAMRVAAGMGVRAIQDNQESLMEEAWEQLAELQSANYRIGLMRLSKEITTATYNKHIQPMAAATGTTVAIGFSVLRFNNPAIQGEERALLNNSWDTVFVNPAFRRMARTGGPLFNRAPDTGIQKLLVYNDLPVFIPFKISLWNYLTFNFQGFKTVLTNSIGATMGIRFIVMRPRWDMPPISVFPADIPALSANFAKALRTVNFTFTRIPFAVKVKFERANMEITQQHLMQVLLPDNSFTRRFKALSTRAGGSMVDNPGDRATPGSFNPVFEHPAYEWLVQANRDMFVPNLDLIPEESSTMLQGNLKFLEAYMAGLNFEMAREFLWRGFPADQNGTFLRRFWDYSDNVQANPAATLDIEPIDKWPTNSQLGRHKPGGVTTPPLFLVIRATLVKKYPNPVIYALRAEWVGTNRRARPNPGPADIRYPSIRAFIEPDFLFAGFEGLTKPMVIGFDDPAKDPGWYFVICERPGELHFGMDISRTNGVAGATWNDLAWTDLPGLQSIIDLQALIPENPVRSNVAWGKGPNAAPADPASGSGDAAQMANILYQRPVRVMIHASNLF